MDIIPIVIVATRIVLFACGCALTGMAFFAIKEGVTNIQDTDFRIILIVVGVLLYILGPVTIIFSLLARIGC